MHSSSCKLTLYTKCFSYGCSTWFNASFQSLIFLYADSHFREMICNSWPVICLCTNALPSSLSNTYSMPIWYAKKALSEAEQDLQVPRLRFDPQSQGQLCWLCLVADPGHHRQTKSSSSPWLRCAASTTSSPENHPNVCSHSSGVLPLQPLVWGHCTAMCVLCSLLGRTQQRLLEVVAACFTPCFITACVLSRCKSGYG